jgi:hypothetical protein
VIHPHISWRPTRWFLFTALVAVLIPVGAAPSLGSLGVLPQTSLPGPLYGVDAITANDVWAVGTRADPNDPDEDIGQAQHWDGTTWSEFPTPDFGELTGTLFDVAGASSSDVWAVGSNGQRSFNAKQLVIEHWDGAGWRLVDAPHASLNDELFGVVAVSATDAWAVGGYSTGGTGLNHTLIEHWDGQRWAIVPTPEFPNSRLRAVDAVSAEDIWAVGPAGTSLHFDGSTWTKVPSPNPRHQVQALNDVSAFAANDVWAAGTRDGGHPFDGLTFSMHWNGTRWRAVKGPSPSSGDEVNGVSALPGGEAWMVGVFFPDAFTDKPLTEHLLGGQWTVVSAPETAILEGVVALASNDVWSVGTAIYHWDGSVWLVVVPG